MHHISNPKYCLGIWNGKHEKFFFFQKCGERQSTSIQMIQTVIFSRRGIDLYHKTCIPLLGNAIDSNLWANSMFTPSDTNHALYWQSIGYQLRDQLYINNHWFFFFIENGMINSQTGYTLVFWCCEFAKIVYVCNVLIVFGGFFWSIFAS